MSKYYDRQYIVDKNQKVINPVEDESIILLRRMVKLLESNAVVDAGNRQRMAVEVMPNVVIGSGTVTTVSTVSSVTNIAALAGAGSSQFIDIARNTYANAIRSKLIFS